MTKENSIAIQRGQTRLAPKPHHSITVLPLTLPIRPAKSETKDIPNLPTTKTQNSTPTREATIPRKRWVDPDFSSHHFFFHTIWGLDSPPPAPATPHLTPQNSLNVNSEREVTPTPTNTATTDSIPNLSLKRTRKEEDSSTLTEYRRRAKSIKSSIKRNRQHLPQNQCRCLPKPKPASQIAAPQADASPPPQNIWTHVSHNKRTYLVHHTSGYPNTIHETWQCHSRLGWPKTLIHDEKLIREVKEEMEYQVWKKERELRLQAAKERLARVIELTKSG